MIEQREIERVKEMLDIVEVAEGLGIELKRSGRNFTGFCPFHDNTKTPAFAVFPATNTWRCFGACGTGGDVISLVEKKNNVDFKEALRFLGAQVGVEIESGAQANHKAELAVLRAATTLYEQALAQSPATLDYLTGRGLLEKTISEFRLGYAPLNDICTNELPKLGYDIPFLIQVGLVVERRDGTIRDRFRDRLMIPITNKSGEVIAFGARADRVPKYVNSPASPWFNKSAVLFGLNKVVQGEPVVVVEGYFDVMRVWQSGGSAVAPMGTALTHEQATILGRSFPKITFAFDGDKAGKNATVKAIEAGRKAFPRLMGLAPYGRGKMTTASYLQTDMYVAKLPPETDPDTLINNSPETWQELVASPTHAIEYMIETLVEGKDLSDVRGKEEVALQIMPLIQTMSPMQYEHWITRLSEVLGENRLSLSKMGVGGGSLPMKADDDNPVLGQMEYIIYLLLSNPSLLPNVNALLTTHNHLEMSPDDFPQYADRLLVKALMDDPHLVIEQGWRKLDKEAEVRLDYVMSQQWQPLPIDKMAYFVAVKVIEWRIAVTQQAISQLRGLLKK